MITTAHVNLPAIKRGCSWDPTIYMYVDGRLKDLTDYTATLTITESADTDDAILTLTSSDGLTLGGTAGTIECEIDATTTASLSVGTAHYSLSLANSSTTDRYMEGSIPIER
ncbi:MAG: hypothetical protein H6Q72_4117 [Firmicutes bacterium]|nr:hypothetical protein [Bacillota bacterium]